MTVLEQLAEAGGQHRFGPPKTAAGRRTVNLPTFLAETLAEQLAGRAEPGPEGLVFPAPVGGPMRRSNFRARAWLPKAIQSRMGDASVSITLDRYGHLFEGLDATWREALAASPRPGRGPDVVPLAR